MARFVAVRSWVVGAAVVGAFAWPGRAHAQVTHPFDGDAVILRATCRSAIGLSADRRLLYLFATVASMDGNQLVDAIFAFASTAGAPPPDVAMNQDGGGSMQHYVEGRGQIVDSGRAVANHLGVVLGGSGPGHNCPALRDPRRLRPGRQSSRFRRTNGAPARECPRVGVQRMTGVSVTAADPCHRGCHVGCPIPRGGGAAGAARGRRRLTRVRRAALIGA